MGKIGGPTANASNNIFVNEDNAKKLINSLCRMRGAALKIAQMLSIQDDAFLPKEYVDIFAKSRHGADVMPMKQLERQMVNELGPDWRKLFKEFNDIPFAAASIGQVHKAVTLSGEEVACKVQYPGIKK